MNLEIRHIERQAVFISVLCHFLFAQIFVFVFPIQPVAHKPPLIFLGSILESQDFTNLVSDKARELTKQAISPTPIQSRQSRFYPEKTTVMKPSFAGNIPKDSRQFLKSSFAEGVSTQRDEKVTKDLGVDLIVPKRIPLRLYFR